MARTSSTVKIDCADYIENNIAVIIDYSTNGNAGTNAPSGDSSDRADNEIRATSSSAEHSAGSERPVGEPTTRSRGRSRRTKKCTPKTRTTIKLRPRRW